MAALTQITEHNFEQEILRSELPVLIEFGAEWCGPCKTVAPELEALSHELQGKAKVVAVDIDKAPLLAREFGVQSVPAFVVFHQGRPVGGKVGVMNRKQLREMLEPVLPRAAGALKPEEIAKLLKLERISLVDTRDADVYARAHISGATNLPASEIESRLAELHMLPAQPVLYCRSGEQTKDLASRLAEAGVPVAFLEGGVLNWEAAGFELERP
jgi:thioredoxin 1/putative thioredoxin